MGQIRGKIRAGQLFRHTESGTVARFTGWRTTITGARLMVLSHPRWGECRWSPERCVPFDPCDPAGGKRVVR